MRSPLHKLTAGTVITAEHINTLAEHIKWLEGQRVAAPLQQNYSPAGNVISMQLFSQEPTFYGGMGVDNNGSTGYNPYNKETMVVGFDYTYGGSNTQNPNNGFSYHADTSTSPHVYNYMTCNQAGVYFINYRLLCFPAWNFSPSTNVSYTQDQSNTLTSAVCGGHNATISNGGGVASSGSGDSSSSEDYITAGFFTLPDAQQLATVGGGGTYATLSFANNVTITYGETQLVGTTIFTLSAGDKIYIQVDYGSGNWATTNFDIVQGEMTVVGWPV